MNRQEKRAHWASAKKNIDALLCPKCGRKVMMVALPHEDTCDIYCPVCYNLLEQGIKPGTRGVMPKEIVKGRYFYASQRIQQQEHLANED